MSSYIWYIEGQLLWTTRPIVRKLWMIENFNIGRATLYKDIKDLKGLYPSLIID